MRSLRGYVHCLIVAVAFALFGDIALSLLLKPMMVASTDHDAPHLRIRPNAAAAGGGGGGGVGSSSGAASARVHRAQHAQAGGAAGGGGGLRPPVAGADPSHWAADAEDTPTPPSQQRKREQEFLGTVRRGSGRVILPGGLAAQGTRAGGGVSVEHADDDAALDDAALGGGGSASDSSSGGGGGAATGAATTAISARWPRAYLTPEHKVAVMAATHPAPLQRAPRVLQSALQVGGASGRSAAQEKLDSVVRRWGIRTRRRFRTVSTLTPENIQGPTVGVVASPCDSGLAFSYGVLGCANGDAGCPDEVFEARLAALEAAATTGPLLLIPSNMLTDGLLLLNKLFHLNPGDLLHLEPVGIEENPPSEDECPLGEGVSPVWRLARRALKARISGVAVAGAGAAGGASGDLRLAIADLTDFKERVATLREALHFLPQYCQSVAANPYTQCKLMQMLTLSPEKLQRATSAVDAAAASADDSGSGSGSGSDDDEDAELAKASLAYNERLQRQRNATTRVRGQVGGRGEGGRRLYGADKFGFPAEALGEVVTDQESWQPLSSLPSAKQATYECGVVSLQREINVRKLRLEEKAVIDRHLELIKMTKSSQYIDEDDDHYFVSEQRGEVLLTMSRALPKPLLGCGSFRDEALMTDGVCGLAKRGIVFIKTQKTAADTVELILKRFCINGGHKCFTHTSSRALNLRYPEHNAQFKHPFPSAPAFSPPYDVLIANTLNVRVSSSVPSALGHVISVVAEPAKRFTNHFSFWLSPQSPVVAGREEDYPWEASQLAKFCIDVSASADYQRRLRAEPLAYRPSLNSMARQLMGCVNCGAAEDEAERFQRLLDDIRAPDSRYHILISERLDESLVLLKHEYHLQWSDLLYISQTTMSQGYRPLNKLTPELHACLTGLNEMDVALYAAALEVHEERVRRKGHRFKKDLAVFSTLVKKTHKTCAYSSSVSTLPPERLNPYQRYCRNEGKEHFFEHDIEAPKRGRRNYPLHRHPLCTQCTLLNGFGSVPRIMEAVYRNCTRPLPKGAPTVAPVRATDVPLEADGLVFKRRQVDGGSSGSGSGSGGGGGNGTAKGGGAKSALDADDELSQLLARPSPPVRRATAPSPSRRSGGGAQPGRLSGKSDDDLLSELLSLTNDAPSKQAARRNSSSNATAATAPQPPPVVPRRNNTLSGAAAGAGAATGSSNGTAANNATFSPLSSNINLPRPSSNTTTTTPSSHPPSEAPFTSTPRRVNVSNTDTTRAPREQPTAPAPPIPTDAPAHQLGAPPTLSRPAHDGDTGAPRGTRTSEPASSHSDEDDDSADAVDALRHALTRPTSVSRRN